MFASYAHRSAEKAETVMGVRCPYYRTNILGARKLHIVRTGARAGVVVVGGRFWKVEPTLTHSCPSLSDTESNAPKHVRIKTTKCMCVCVCLCVNAHHFRKRKLSRWCVCVFTNVTACSFISMCFVHNRFVLIMNGDHSSAGPENCNICYFNGTTFPLHNHTAVSIVCMLCVCCASEQSNQTFEHIMFVEKMPIAFDNILYTRMCAQ